MKKTIVRILTGVVLGCLLLVAVFTVIVHRETAELNKSAMLERTYLLSDEQMAAGQLDFRDNIVATSEFSEGLLIEADETVTISLSVPASGSYHLIAEYSAPDKNLFDNPIDFVVGDVSFTAELSFLWADDISSLVTDRYGNEVLPDQYQLPYAVSFLERALNDRQLHDQLLQPPQRAQRLGDLVKARLRPLSRAHTPSSSARLTTFKMSP